MYYIYILRCEDGSLYSGITTNLARRFDQHCGKKTGGAKYAARHRPRFFEAAWTAPDRSAASKLEYRLKHLGRCDKEKLLLGKTPNGLELSDYERFI